MSDDRWSGEWDPPPLIAPPLAGASPPPGFPGGPDGRPPRNRRPLRVFMIGSGVSVAVILVAAVLVGTVHYRDEILARWAPPGWSASPPSTPSSSPTSSSSPKPSNAPRSSASSTTSSAGGYGTPEHNRIYRTAPMRSVHCRADLRSTAQAAYRRYAKRVTACLDRAWRPVLRSAGIAFRAPGVVVAADPRSPCGDDEVGYHPFAYYCETDQTMYFSTRQMTRGGYTIRDRDYLMESVIHEYGHHVQTLYGLWPYYAQRRDAARSDVARYTRLSRRAELQPQCFAGMFMGRNASTMHVSESGAKDMAAHTGDDGIPGVTTHPKYRTHGHDRNSGYFFARGWDTGRAASCNTWTAPASRVS